MENYRKGSDLPLSLHADQFRRNEDAEFWVGATRATNNTAEMQALIGALYWLNSGIEDKSVSDDMKIIVTVESLCKGPDRPEIHRERQQSYCDASLSPVESGQEQSEY